MFALALRDLGEHPHWLCLQTWQGEGSSLSSRGLRASRLLPAGLGVQPVLQPLCGSWLFFTRVTCCLREVWSVVRQPKHRSSSGVGCQGDRDLVASVGSGWACTPAELPGSAQARLSADRPCSVSAGAGASGCQQGSAQYGAASACSPVCHLCSHTCSSHSLTARGRCVHAPMQLTSGHAWVLPPRTCVQEALQHTLLMFP